MGACGEPAKPINQPRPRSVGGSGAAALRHVAAAVGGRARGLRRASNNQALLSDGGWGTRRGALRCAARGIPSGAGLAGARAGRARNAVAPIPMPKYMQRARRRPARKSAEMATEGKAPNRYVCCPPRAPAAERWPTPRSRLGRVIACAAPAASATAHAAAAARRKRPKAVPLAAGPRARANARERVRKGTHSHPGVRRQTRCRNRRGLRRLRGSAAFAAKRHWRRLTLDFRPCIPCCRRR